MDSCSRGDSQDVAKAIDPLNDRIGHIESTLETIQNQTANMNGRLAAIESEEVRHVDRADRAAAELAQLNDRLTIPEINDPARRRIS